MKLHIGCKNINNNTDPKSILNTILRTNTVPIKPDFCPLVLMTLILINRLPISDFVYFAVIDNG